MKQKNEISRWMLGLNIALCVLVIVLLAGTIWKENQSRQLVQSLTTDNETLKVQLQAEQKKPVSLDDLLKVTPRDRFEHNDQCWPIEKGEYRTILWQLRKQGNLHGYGDYGDDNLNILSKFGIWSPDCSVYIYPFPVNRGPESYQGVWLYDPKTDQNTKLKEGESYVHYWLNDTVVVLSDGLLNIETKQFVQLKSE